MLGTVALLIAIAAGMLVWSSSHAAAPLGTPRAEPNDPDPQAMLRTGRHEAPEPSHADPSLADQRAPLGADDGAATRVIGRAIAAESGAPIAGAVASIARSNRRKVSDWTAPAPVATGADGRYALAFRGDPALHLDLRIEAPGRVPVRGGWWRLRAGVTLDCGDVALPAAVPTTLRVVDERDAAVAGYVAQITSVAPGAPRHVYGIRPTFHYGHQRTDSDGRLPALLLAAGEWKIDDVSGTGWEFLGPHGFTIEPFEREKMLTLRVAQPAPAETIAGRVLDTHGLAIAGLELWLTAGEGDRGRRTTATLADGTFFFPRLLVSEPPYRIGLHERQAGFALDGTQPFVEAALGATDVELLVRRLPAVPVELTVVEAESDRPIERFAWSAVRVLDGRFDVGGTAKLGPSEHHARGVAAIPSLHAGEHVLFLRPDDRERADVLALPLAVAEPGPLAVRVPVARRASWRVRVRDDLGAPVAGSSVRLRQAIDGGDVRGWGGVLAVDDALGIGAWGTRPVLVTAQALTDAQGFAALRSAPQLGAAGLDVQGPTHARALIEPVAIPQDGSAFEVTVSRAAVVEGRLEPASLLEEYGPDAAARERARLFAPDDDQVAGDLPEILLRAADHRTGARAYVRADATFRLESVPAGSWLIALSVRFQQPDGSSDQIEQAVGSVDDLQAGEHRRIVVDASALRRTLLRGTVLLNGQPARAARLVLEARTASATARTAADGTFALRLRPGAYLPRLQLEEEGRTKSIWSPQPIELHAGEAPANAVLAFERTAARVRILAPGGKPFARRIVSLHPLEEGGVGEDRMLVWGRTDAEGRVVFDPAPPFAASVWAWGPQPIGGRTPAPTAWSAPTPGLRIGTLPRTVEPGRETELVIDGT